MATRLQGGSSAHSVLLMRSIPADILAWLDHNAHCRPSDLVNSLIKAGHQADRSETWVKVYFDSKNQLALAGQAGLAQSTLDQPKADYFAPSGDFGPAFPNYLVKSATSDSSLSSSSIRDAGASYPISMACSAPRVLHVLDVLSMSECDAIVEASRPSLTQSTVVSNTDSNSAVSKDVRSSFGTYFPRGTHPVVKAVEERIADLFRFPLSHAEPIQILNYAPNAEYKPHHDYFDETSAEGQRIVARSGNRVATLIMYLNEVERGGATIFPKLNLQVLPRKGSVLYFDYALPGGVYDPDSLHGGTPVLAGEKWIATQWVRCLPYVG